MAGIFKQTKGRQKIKMKRIENEDDRLITFSKRRSGIYKKASELVTLCGAEVGILVFSPSGKPFSFGHPSFECIANRYLGKKNSTPNDTTHPLVEAHTKMRVNELNQRHNEVLFELDEEKERGKMLKVMVRGKGGRQGWWDAPTDELNLQQLQQMHAKFEELHGNLCKKFSGFSVRNSNSNNPFFLSNAPSTEPFSFLHGYGYAHRYF